MEELICFIRQDSSMNELLKAALVPFYLAYRHPYFDGNGRMARLLHLWCLVQQGYSSSLFVPLSGYVERSRKKYYDAYALCEQNAAIRRVLDVTPFLVYFIENIYHKLWQRASPAGYDGPLSTGFTRGKITQKENVLW